MDRRPLLRIRASCCTHAADPSPVLRAPAVSSPSYYLYALSDRVATQASVDRRADSPACLPTIFGLRLARCRTLTWPAGNHTYQARPSVGRVRLPLTRSGPANNLLVDRLAIGPTVSLAASPSCIARSGPLCPPADADCRPSARRPSRLWRDRWSILRCRPHACPEPRSPSAGEHCHPYLLANEPSLAAHLAPHTDSPPLRPTNWTRRPLADAGGHPSTRRPSRSWLASCLRVPSAHLSLRMPYPCRFSSHRPLHATPNLRRVVIGPSLSSRVACHTHARADCNGFA